MTDNEQQRDPSLPRQEGEPQQDSRSQDPKQDKQQQQQNPQASGDYPSRMPGPVSSDSVSGSGIPEGRPLERKSPGRAGARGTAAMDPQTRKEVARKGGLAVSRNKQHMAEIGRKGGQSVSKNREHMASIGRKGGEASRGSR